MPLVFRWLFLPVWARPEVRSIVLDTEATATFVPGEGITGIVLSVKGSADGVSEADFLSLAEDAKENCPVSQALTRGVPISLDASMS